MVTDTVRCKAKDQPQRSRVSVRSNKGLKATLGSKDTHPCLALKNMEHKSNNNDNKKLHQIKNTFLSESSQPAVRQRKELEKDVRENGQEDWRVCYSAKKSGRMWSESEASGGGRAGRGRYRGVEWG